MSVLEPHSEYNVSLNAMNGAGNGSSVTELVRTKEHGQYDLLCTY